MAARVSALALAATTFLPWLTSLGTSFRGSPFPLVDWVVGGVALAAAIRLSLARAAAVTGATSVVVTLLALFVDQAEGQGSSAEYGLGLAMLAVALLWLVAGPSSSDARAVAGGRQKI